MKNKITIDINLIASKMKEANVTSTEDNWTNTLMDILEEEYNIETQVRIKMFGK